MQKYCTNCGARIIGDIKFCDRCGESCKPSVSKRPPASSGNVIKRKKSSGIWKFFAGTAVGAFFMHFFGGSASASSSSNSNHTETIENYHDTVVYAREREYVADDVEDYEDDDFDDVSDDYDDSYDDGYDDDE